MANHRISGTEAEIPRGEERVRVDTTPLDFEPYKPKIRKYGTGCVTTIYDTYTNEHSWKARNL